MKIAIIKSYNDSCLHRNVRNGEELNVSEIRAKKLIDSGVAVMVCEDTGDMLAKIAELEKAVEEKDIKIAELEKAVGSLTAKSKK